jgi:hypothetical protein
MTPAALEHHLAHVDPDGVLSEAERLKAAEARHRTMATNGRLGGLVSWGNTEDRTARTKPGYSKSPASLDCHIAKVAAEQAARPPKDRMSEGDQLKAAKARHRAHMLRLAQASAAARRANAKPRKSRKRAA